MYDRDVSVALKDHCDNVSESVRRLERFFARELDVEVWLFSVPGVHLLSSTRREAESWCGYRLPVFFLERGESSVLSVEADFLPRARELLGEGAEGLAVARDLLVDSTVRWTSARLLDGYSLYCEPDGFRPQCAALTEKLMPWDPEWEQMSEHFDGPVFVTRTSGGHVASWAAVKLKDEHVWEIAVTTEEAYRGRGLAKAVVSAATEYVLAEGRVPLYTHDEANPASGRVAQALGFTPFGREAYCSVGETNLTGMW